MFLGIILTLSCFLQAYAANYTGHAKIDRLLFVAKASEGRPLELDALKMAVDALKQVRKSNQLAYCSGRCGARMITPCFPPTLGHIFFLICHTSNFFSYSTYLQTENTAQYREVTNRIAGRAGPNYNYDRYATPSFFCTK